MMRVLKLPASCGPYEVLLDQSLVSLEVLPAVHMCWSPLVLPDRSHVCSQRLIQLWQAYTILCKLICFRHKQQNATAHWTSKTSFGLTYSKTTKDPLLQTCYPNGWFDDHEWVLLPQMVVQDVKKYNCHFSISLSYLIQSFFNSGLECTLCIR